MPTVSDLKSFDREADGSTVYHYDEAHRELSKDENAKPCTCQIRARERQNTAGYPSLVEKEDLDPDCELHFPWMIEDEAERMAAMRWWYAGYHAGFDTADQLRDADPSVRQLAKLGFEIVREGIQG